jgi:transcriptional regulator with XRE-family HTH domain
MEAGWRELPELRDVGANLSIARLERALSQGALAKASRLSQTQVSLFEAGRRLPSLDQFVRLARALDLPIQRLLTGADRPGVALKDLVVELRELGAVDLWVADAAIPGAARCPEEVIAFAVSGRSLDSRVVETLPALLSWNQINPVLLRAFGIVTKTTYRLAWLAEAALAVERRSGFPGGCRHGQLERFVRLVRLPPREAPWDDLGRPSESPPSSPVWRKWRISYGAKLEDFTRRALALTPRRNLEKQAAANGRTRARLVDRKRVRSSTFAKSIPKRAKVGGSPSDAKRTRSHRKEPAGGQ